MGIKIATAPAADKIEETDLVETVTTMALLPVKAFSESDRYINEQSAGQAALIALGAGYFVGEAHGHKRERDGKKSFVPLFRG